MAEEKGGVNVYTCDTCRGHIVTRNRDAGTTPFMLECHATSSCRGTMYSHFYKVDQGTAAGFEWFTPRSAGERKKINSPAVADHVAMGGLLLRSLAN